MDRELSWPRCLPKWAIAALTLLLPIGCATTGDCQHPLLHCRNKDVKAPLTVMVTGLVKHPGTYTIPLGGLLLKDAIALAQGDVPAQFFDGVNPSQVLVSVERPTKTYHFALPLVTKDVAGRIFLVPGDKVSLELGSTTDLGRSVVRSANPPTTPNQDVETWKSILHRDDVGQKPLSYDITFSDLNVAPRKVTITIPQSAAANDSQPRSKADAAAPPADAAQQPGLKVQMSDPNQPRGNGLRVVDAPALEANLQTFSDVSNSPEESTVLVLTRQMSGKTHQFVLLRPGSIATGAERSIVQQVLKGVTVIPGDSVAMNAAVQIPLVLSSLATPKLYDFAARQDACCPKLKEECQSVANTFRPLTDPIKRATALICSPLAGSPISASAPPSR